MSWNVAQIQVACVSPCEQNPLKASWREPLPGTDVKAPLARRDQAGTKLLVAEDGIGVVLSIRGD